MEGYQRMYPLTMLKGAPPPPPRLNLPRLGGGGRKRLLRAWSASACFAARWGSKALGRMCTRTTNTHARTRARTDGRTHTRTDVHTHPRTHAPTHPRTHAPTQPRTHAPTHPRTRGVRMCFFGVSGSGWRCPAGFRCTALPAQASQPEVISQIPPLLLGGSWVDKSGVI